MNKKVGEAMKRAEEYLKDFRQKTSSDDMIDKLLEDPVIRRFVLENDLKHDTITLNMNGFMTFKEAKTTCQNCPGIYDCKLGTSGMTPMLRFYQDDVILDYTKCRFNTFDETKLKIDALYVPRKIFNSELSDFDLIGNERKAIHQYIMDFLKNYSKNSPKKGMYISGIFGAGKTYILACVANELAKAGYSILFAYYPDLVRELKSSIGSGDLEKKVERLKSANILFLDDIGGEAPSAFIRDEVLGPILQHRVLENLPTFFSSNMPVRVLRDSLRIDNSDTEKVKASRIYERILVLAEEFVLTEKPRI